MYVADNGNNRVVALDKGSSTQRVLPLHGLNKPSGLAVDTKNAVYVADYGNNRVLKIDDAHT